jgi:hypothetical protein
MACESEFVGRAQTAAVVAARKECRMDMTTDFLCETILHVSEVSENLEIIASELRKRGCAHDRTKFQALEFDAFVSTREKFKKANYGTPEYQECVDIVKPAVDHHHANNRHHTGFHAAGVSGMSLIDLAEMIADWKAAERRSPDKKLKDTLDYAFNKYGIGKQLGCILRNTMADLGWIEESPSMAQEARLKAAESQATDA